MTDRSRVSIAAAILATLPLTLDIKCPKEGCDGELMERKTRGRKSFYGCSKYPKCDYAMWDIPVKKDCPSCKNHFMVAKSSKTKGEYFLCPICKHKLVEEAQEAEPVS